MKNITLQSERLVFERLAIKHVSEDYLKWLNDPSVNRFLEVKGGNNMSMLTAYVNTQYEKEVYFWAILLRDTHQHIGNIKIDPIDWKTDTAEYGILMGDKRNWGKGYAKEASLRILQYCFRELGLSKITLGVIEENINAVKLYQKIGFSIDEIKKDTGVYDQKLCNSLRMSLDVENFN